MARNKKGGIPSNNSRRVDLARIQDTSSTIDSPLPLNPNKQNFNQGYVKVDPPFKSGKENSATDWGKLGTISAIVIFLITAIASAIWYIAQLDSNVNVLKSDMVDVKKHTEDLVKTTIQHNEKLNVLDKTITSYTETRKNTKKK